MFSGWLLPILWRERQALPRSTGKSEQRYPHSRSVKKHDLSRSIRSSLPMTCTRKRGNRWNTIALALGLRSETIAGASCGFSSSVLRFLCLSVVLAHPLVHHKARSLSTPAHD